MDLRSYLREHGADDCTRPVENYDDYDTEHEEPSEEEV